jgi:hypothetical protein
VLVEHAMPSTARVEPARASSSATSSRSPDESGDHRRQAARGARGIGGAGAAASTGSTWRTSAWRSPVATIMVTAHRHTTSGPSPPTWASRGGSRTSAPCGARVGSFTVDESSARRRRRTRRVARTDQMMRDLHVSWAPSRPSHRREVVPEAWAMQLSRSRSTARFARHRRRALARRGYERVGACRPSVVLA